MDVLGEVAVVTKHGIPRRKVVFFQPSVHTIGALSEFASLCSPLPVDVVDAQELVVSIATTSTRNRIGSGIRRKHF